MSRATELAQGLRDGTGHASLVLTIEQALEIARLLESLELELAEARADRDDYRQQWLDARYGKPLIESQPDTFLPQQHIPEDR